MKILIDNNMQMNKLWTISKLVQTKYANVYILAYLCLSKKYSAMRIVLNFKFVLTAQYMLNFSITHKFIQPFGSLEHF